MIVVDASVWVSAIIDDDTHHEISFRWVSDWNLAGGEIAAPMLLLSEVAGSVARRHRLPDAGQRALANMMHDPTLHLFDIDRELAEMAAQLSAKFFLKVADAMYAALALQLNVALITWDREQLQRAVDVIDVRTPHI